MQRADYMESGIQVSRCLAGTGNPYFGWPQNQDTLGVIAHFYRSRR